jgi:hypothetical protein
MKNKKLAYLSVGFLMSAGLVFSAPAHAKVNIHEVMAEALEGLDDGADKVGAVVSKAAPLAKEAPYLLSKLRAIRKKGIEPFLIKALEKHLVLSYGVVRTIKGALTSSTNHKIIAAVQEAIDDVNGMADKAAGLISKLEIKSGRIKTILSVLKTLRTFAQKIKKIKNIAVSKGLITKEGRTILDKVQLPEAVPSEEAVS